MSKITTEDCKEFLIKTLNLPSTLKIKRLKKYKDTDGLYLRDFSDENGKNYTLKELADGSLSFRDSSHIQNNPPQFNTKKFLKQIIKKLENGDDDEVIEKYIKQIQGFSPEDKKKLASEFTFFFPNDTYHNEIDTVDQGINTLMIKEHHSYCINFYDNTESDPDLYLTDILRAILPEFFDKVDEYHFEIEAYSKNNSINSMTIKNTINLLEDLGFSYNPKSRYDEECMLSVMNINPCKNDNVNKKKHKL